MTPKQYKLSRLQSGLKVQEWCERLGISRSAHEQYSSGHLAVPAWISAHIATIENSSVVESMRLSPAVTHAIRGIYQGVKSYRKGKKFKCWARRVRSEVPNEIPGHEWLALATDGELARLFSQEQEQSARSQVHSR